MAFLRKSMYAIGGVIGVFTEPSTGVRRNVADIGERGSSDGKIGDFRDERTALATRGDSVAVPLIGEFEGERIWALASRSEGVLRGLPTCLFAVVLIGASTGASLFAFGSAP